MRLMLVFVYVGAALSIAAGPARAEVVDKTGLIDGRGFVEFDQVNYAIGSLTPSGITRFSGTESAFARFNGGANGYARGIHNINWKEGDDVWYGASFFLPSGFKAGMQGQVDILRWDNYTTDPTHTDRGGIVIFNADKQAHFIRQRLGIEEVTLGTPFSLPEGRWFRLTVHQRLSTTSPLSEAYLDDKKVFTSTANNMYGRGPERLRYGIVAIDANKQKNKLELFFDSAGISSSKSGLPQPTGC